MKKLLFIAAFLLPAACFAQLLELGINGGLIPYSSYKAVDQPVVNWDLKKEKGSSYSYGGRVALNFRRIQIGVAAEWQSIMQKSTAEGSTSLGSFQFTGLENKVASDFLATYLYLNLGKQLPAGYLYIGLSGGYAMTEMSSYAIGTSMANKPMPVETISKAKGYIAGGQAGWVMGIGRRIGISFEVALRYASLNSEFAKQGTSFNSAGYDNTLLYMPVLIGLRYQIGRGCSTY